MSAAAGVGAEFLARVDAVESRLHAAAAIDPAPDGLTEPDQPSGEQWDWGQVWAHLGEFVPYWVRQIQTVLSADPGADLPSFGRVQTDPARLAAIEADRHRPTQELYRRLEGQLVDMRALLAAMSAADWKRSVSHSTLGALDMSEVAEMFLVGHLEGHADQLEGLVNAANS